MSTVGEVPSSDPLLRRNAKDQISLVRSAEIDYILDMAVDEAMRMVKARYGNFFLFDQNGRLSPCNTSAPASEEAQRLAEHCVATRTNGAFRPDEPADGLPADLEIKSAALCVYMGLQEGDLGAIVLRDPLFFPHFFEADMSLIKNFAATFCILLKNGWTDRHSSQIFLNFKTSLLLLLENAHLNQKIKESDYQLNAVLEVSNLINSSRELSEMIQAVLYSARRVIRAESASLFLVDEKTGELYFDIVSDDADKATNLRGMRIPQGQGIVGLSAREKRSIIVNDARSDPRVYRAVDEATKMTTRNILASPLLVGGHTIGVVEVLNTIDRAAFTEHDLEIFESFSDSVAIALQRRRLLDDLQSTNLELEKRLRETTCLHAVAGALVEAVSSTDLFQRVLGIIRKDLNVGRASILIYNQETGNLDLAAHEGTRPFSDDDVVNENSLARHVFRTAHPVLIEDVSTSEELKHLAQPHRYSSKSCIVAPLVSPAEPQPIGVLCLTEPTADRFFDDDYRLVLTIASQLVRGFENFKLNQEIITKKAIEKEVEITSRIQKNILPASIPRHLHMELAARSVMAKTTGGDFYDFFVHSPNGDVTLLVADVSGKSLPAALFMAISSSILRTIIRAHTDPVKIMELSNDLLFEESQSGMFVTVFLGRYEPSSSRLRFASAGHNDMLVIHPDGSFRRLSGKGAPLGVISSYKQKYIGGEMEVSEGDLMVLYTDGVIEGVNEQNEEYGLDRFVDLVRGLRDRPPMEIVDLVYNSVTEFCGSEPQFDDFTLLIARFHGIARGYRDYHITLPAVVDSIPLLRDFVMTACQRHGMSGQDLEDVLLVSDEAATNIVVHAYGDANHEPGSFECDLEIDTNRFVRMHFRDQGAPFRLEDVPEPDLRENLAGKRKGGFGVYLIRSLMHTVEYSRRDGVNHLRVEKMIEHK